jgi:sugar/nucleoside kinase (ribokinase family)
MSLLVTGTIGIDTLHAPTGEASGVLGGSCAYFAAAASQLTSVRLVGAVGGDWPEAHERQLRAFRNICLDGLERRANSQTFAWGGRYFDNMNRRETLFTRLGVLEEAPPKVPAKYLDSKTMFLANSHPLVQLDLLRQLKNQPFVVCDTMDLWINIARPELMQLLAEVDGVIMNDEEAMQLTECRNVVTAGRRILESGPRSFVVVKKGEHGAILIHRDGVASVPAFPADLAQVVDPTGAGDTFAGGFMAHVARAGRTDFDTLRHAMAWGTVLASFTIEAFGLERLARLDAGQVNDRFRAFRAMTAFDAHA